MSEAPAIPRAPARTPDRDKIPYQHGQPFGMVPDIVIAGGFAADGDERLWVPQSEVASFRPLVLNVTQGYYVNVLRVRRAGILSRHRHFGPVHAFVMKGSWRYLEHDWVAREGDFVFEPPGETHTLVVPEEVTEMITLFHVTGGYAYCDPDGAPTGVEDVFTKLEAARRHYAAVGLGEDYAQRFVR